MSQERCPNCRAERRVGDTPCRQCGWMPLRSTEMLFVDDQTVTCPHCSRQRPVADQVCSHCGRRDVLESVARHTANFHISSLLLLTTLLSIMTLEGMWSWDDAFPKVASHVQQSSLVPESQTQPAINVVEDEGIEFPDEILDRQAETSPDESTHDDGMAGAR